MSGRLNGRTRSEGAAAEAEFRPSEEWRERFESQATKPILERLNRIARARLGIYAGGKQRVHESAVDDIVIGALGDTWNGTLAWDPDRRSLFLHLRDAIKYRVRDQARLARNQRSDGHLEEDDGAMSIADRAATGATLPTVTDDEPKIEALGDFVDATLDALRPLAVRDREVMSLLDALSRRVVDRHDLLEETGMTIVEYNNAWRRLARLAHELPAQLRDDALAALA